LNRQAAKTAKRKTALDHESLNRQAAKAAKIKKLNFDDSDWQLSEVPLYFSFPRRPSRPSRPLR